MAGVLLRINKANRLDCHANKLARNDGIRCNDVTPRNDEKKYCPRPRFARAEKITPPATLWQGAK